MKNIRQDVPNTADFAPTKWQGWLDSNQRMRESKSLALPLGYTPVSAKRKISGPEPKLRPFRLFMWGG